MGLKMKLVLISGIGHENLGKLHTRQLKLIKGLKGEAVLGDQTKKISTGRMQ